MKKEKTLKFRKETGKIRIFTGSETDSRNFQEKSAVYIIMFPSIVIWLI